MATVTGYTAERMKEIEDSAIIAGVIVGNDLILTRFDGEQVNAGNVRGPQGPTGSLSDTSIQIVTSSTRPENPYTGVMIYETDTAQMFRWDGVQWLFSSGVWLTTSTTRPDYGFNGFQIYETDTKRYYTHDGVDWVYSGGVTLCTSLSRPAFPFTGLSIYETDTKKSYTWNGTSWVQNSPKAMRCKVNRNTSQSIFNNLITPIVWTTEEYDTDNLWALGANADSFIIPANGAGPWRFTLNASYAIHATGGRHFGILKNGVQIATFNSPGSASWMVGGSVVVETNCSAGDVIKAYSYHTAGVSLNVDVVYPISFSAIQLF